MGRLIGIVSVSVLILLSTAFGYAQVIGVGFCLPGFEYNGPGSVGCFCTSNPDSQCPLDRPEPTQPPPTQAPITTPTETPTKMPSKKVEVVAQPTQDSDPIVDCTVQSECGGITKRMRSSDCQKSYCCLVDRNDWRWLDSKEECEQLQAKTMENLDRAIAAMNEASQLFNEADMMMKQIIDLQNQEAADSKVLCENTCIKTTADRIDSGYYGDPTQELTTDLENRIYGDLNECKSKCL